MNYARHSVSSATVALLLGFGLLLVPFFSAHAQTNDPKIDQQDYLETVNVPGAWNLTGATTPAPMAIIGPGGVLSTHEDLLSTQVSAPPGAYEPDSLMPSTSTFAGGITHATTNNGTGIASISNRWGFGEFCSYEAGTLKDFEDIPNAVYVFDMDEATTHTYDALQDKDAEILLTPAVVFENEDPSVTVSADLLANPIQVPRTDLEIPGFLGGILEGIGSWLYEEIVRNQKIADFNAAHTLTAKSEKLTVAPIGDFDGTETVWPASSSSSEIAFSVGGTTQEGTSRWANSALSAVDDPDDGTLDLVAPAENVFSTLNHKQPGEPKYGSQNSTVGSAAMAAGVASLLKGIAPDMVGDDLRQVLQRTANDIADPGYDKQTGHGRLDAKDAVQYVQERSFTRSTVANGSVTVVEDDLTTFTMTGGPWTSLASGKYDIEEKYKVQWTINLPEGSDHDIWIRHPDTKGWSEVNPATGHPWADIEIRSWESEATITTYGYQGYTYDTLGRIISTYGYPVKAEDAKVAYTVATKPGTPPSPPLNSVSTNGPTVLDEGEQGTWSATPSPPSSSPSYTWYVDQGNGWYQIGSGPSVSWGQDYISSTIIVDIKVEASKNGETASAQTKVTINNNGGGGGGVEAVMPSG
ncbi:S8 family serine peptidase [Salinibacter sp.]|uniref:S8 family serine peptidase n=1 Tax=Salinibacter sp. TaxID=2065818 RepID=UPI0021E8CD18|nr:S8 family serine peptidase [Salinibacter sp.]